ncbi:MAG: putative bifunctional diguanylate cyclase/phosphodiesterase [Lachnospiraceae bacterium]
MSKLVSSIFQEFFNSIPEGERNEQVISELFDQYVPQLAKACNFVFYQSEILYENKMNPSQKTKIVLFKEGEAPLIEKQREIFYHLDNGGLVKVTAAVSEYDSWDEEKEADFAFLAKMLYFIYGRTKVLRQLFEVSFIDKLTGVANEEQLFIFMGRLLEAGKLSQYSSNFINIKNMKLFNEFYGNKQGNQILKTYATKIKDFVGRTGCVCRLGGDNFFVVIEKEREDDLLTFLKELCVEIILPGDRFEFVKIDSRVGYYNIQIGDGPDAVMNNSSFALNMAKANRNSDIICFQDEMKADIIKLRQLEDSIPDAIENREFLVYYQPKVMLLEDDNYILCGAEALVRWNKEGRMISPAEFVPIIEKNGLITEIDYYVFETVCQHIKKWERDGLTPVCVSSNFSRRHLRDPRFADKVEEIVRIYQVNPSYLEIEITESYDEEDLEALTKFEQRMHALGIRLAMDDFGSGFSSLKMLKDMAADIVKLDKSIIDGVGGQNKDDEIIVSHMIHMIHSLGKKLIAEGVETTEQAAFLKSNGCMMIQGFLYGRPMAETEFRERIEQGR